MLDNLLVRLIGDGSSFQAMMKNAESSVTRVNKTFSRMGMNITKMGQNVARTGRVMTMAITLPLIGLGSLAASEFSKFDKAMTESTSIMTRLADDQKTQMKDLALSMSGEVLQAPTELARSYFFLASAGLDAQQSMAALPQVAKFATAGAFDMALATDLLTDAQSALGLTTKDAAQNVQNMARVSDVLVKANTLANASVEQFSKSLTSDAGATLKNYNKDVAEGVAVLAAYANQGIKAEHAGNMFGRVTRLMIKASQNNEKALKKHNLAIFDGNGKLKNYADIMQQLERITKGMSDETKSATLKQLGFTALTQKALLPLIGMSTKIREYEKELRKAGGTTDTVANKQMASFASQMQLAKNKVTVLAIEIGEALAPSILKMNERIGALIDRYRALTPEQKALVAQVVVFAAALGPALVVVGTLLSSFGSVITTGSAAFGLLGGLGRNLFVVLGMVAGVVGWPVTLVVGIMAAITALRYYTGSWENAGLAVGGFVDYAVDALIMINRILFRSFSATIGWLDQKFKEFWTMDFLTAIKNGIAGAVTMFKAFTKWAAAKLISAFRGGINDPGELLNQTAFKDFQQGRQANNNLLGQIGNIAQEEFQLFQQNREGKTIIPARDPSQPPLLDSITNSNEMKLVVDKLTSLVDLGQKELAKPPIETTPAGLK